MLLYNQNIETNIGKKRIGILYDLLLKGKHVPLVKSYDEKNKSFSYKKIDYITKTYIECPIYKITCGNREITCLNADFLKDNDWVDVSGLKIGDCIKTTPAESIQLLRSLNDDQEQVVFGSFLGDGCLNNNGLNRYRLRVIHGIKQMEYCKWMSDLFNCKTKIIEKNGYAQTPAIEFTTKMFGLNNQLPKNKSTCPQWVIDKLDERGLAIWFMDDGSSFGSGGATISTCSFDEDSQYRLAVKLKSMNIDCRVAFSKVKNRKVNGYHFIYINTDGYKSLCNMIAPYIHANLAYKIKYNKENIGSYKWNNEYNVYGLTVIDKIEKIESKRFVYNLKTKENDNFIVCSQSLKTMGGILIK